MDFSLQLQRSKVLGFSKRIGGIAHSQTALGSIKKRIGQKYAAVKVKPAGKFLHHRRTLAGSLC
jgi:hypothetical protein